MQIVLRYPDENGRPGEVVDSLTVLANRLNFADLNLASSWVVDEWQGDTTSYTFERGEEFFVGFRSLVDVGIDSVGSYFRISEDPGAPETEEGRTLLLGDDGQWYATREVGAGVKFDLYAYAVIEYLNDDSTLVRSRTGESRFPFGVERQ